MDDYLSIAVYTYRDHKCQRLHALLNSIRLFEGDIHHTIVVCEDYDASQRDRQSYLDCCRQYDARHVPLHIHAHMGGANDRAVRECSSPFVLVCSDDVMVTRGLIPDIERFLINNKVLNEYLVDRDGLNMRGLAQRIAGIYLHHWDRTEMFAMGKNGMIPEIAGFGANDDPYNEWFEDRGRWLWRELDGIVPIGPWTENTPEHRVSICSNVHGSAYVIRKDVFVDVGGTAGCACWQNDSLLSARVNWWTDKFFIRLPGLPSVCHYGGAADTPADPEGKWVESFQALCDEHGYEYRECDLQQLEWAWKLRCASLQKKFQDEINALDYSYKDYTNA